MRYRYLLVAILLCACSSTPPGGETEESSSDTEADPDATVAADADAAGGECPCPDSLVCEEGFCVRPGGPEDAGADSSTPEDADESAPDTADTRDGSADSGDTCVCSTESTCCDGCQPRNEGEGCDNGKGDNPAKCQSGTCVDVSYDECNCGTADSCCDGCFYTPGKVCDRGRRKECKNPDAACSEVLLVQERVRRCVSETGRPNCSAEWTEWETIERRECGRAECCEIKDDFSDTVCQ